MFNLKLLHDELPTKKQLSERKPYLYTDNTCVFCKKDIEDSLHIFTCNGYMSILLNMFKKLIIKKTIEKEEQISKTKIITELHNRSFLKIDIFRQL